MKEFTYNSPSQLEEAIGLLAGGNARPFAGGTDLLVQMRAGRLNPEVVVDLKAIPELNVLKNDAQSGLVIGAAVPCYKVYENEGIARAYPGLIDAASIVGGIGIQGRATLGGNLCNSSPSGDTIPVMIVLGAIANIVGPKGVRSVPVAGFCTAPGRNVLEPGEILVSITFPAPIANSGAHYQRFIPRNEMDIAVVGVAASVVLSDDKRTIKTASVALAAVGPTPIVVQGVSELLAGKPATEESLAGVIEAAKAAAKPISDMRGSVVQRRHLVGVLTRRVLLGAIGRAKGEVVHSAH